MMLFYTICLATLMPSAFGITCENKQATIGSGYKRVEANGGATCDDSKWCMTMKIETADLQSVFTQCAGDNHKTTCDMFANDKCWEIDNTGHEDTKTEICCCKTEMCNKTPYEIDKRGSQESEQSAADGGTDDQKLDEFDKVPAKNITTVAGSTNLPLTFRCENKQIGIGGGYESVQEYGGATCKDSEWCMTKKVMTADTMSIVTQCANDETNTCNTFANDKCWVLDNTGAEDTESIICCCKTDMCNKTPYKVGVRRYEVPEDRNKIGDVEDGRLNEMTETDEANEALILSNTITALFG